MASNLYAYYTGKGQALPSVSARASQYSSLGLGGGYTGTAAQNAAMLAKLNGGSSAPAAGGYSQTPSGSPQPVNNDPGYGDLTSFTNQNAADRQALIDRLNSESSGAYDKFAGQYGLTDAQAALKSLTDQNAAVGTKLADLPMEINQEVKGTFASDGQRAGEIGTASVPYQAALSKLATILPGASLDVQNRQHAVDTNLSVLHDNQARQISGFDKSSENELAAIQDKVARGRQLTDQEFERETQLSAAKMQYEATVKAAQAGAGATIQAANIQASASKANNQNALDQIAVQMGYKSYSDFQKALSTGGSGTVLNQILGQVKGGTPAGQASPSINIQGPGASKYGW